jgi:hypothetical protein
MGGRLGEIAKDLAERGTLSLIGYHFFARPGEKLISKELSIVGKRKS